MKRSLVSLALLAACSGSTDPATDVRTSLLVEPAQVALGDTVQITVIAFNPTDRTIDLFPSQCGHSLAPAVTDPAGSTHQLWGGPSICPLFDDNVLAPNETDSVTWRWKAGPQTGAYLVRGGIARGTELVNPTPPFTLTVN